MAHASACHCMIGRNSMRRTSLNCLESLSHGWVKSSGNITAAANTGPARQPRPASSQPASRTPLMAQAGKGCESLRLANDFEI